MPTINEFVSCPADCDEDVLIGAIPVVQDCISYKQAKSQLHTLYLRLCASGVYSTDPFTNFATTPTVTAGAIDNTETDNSKSKFIVGEGAIGEPIETVVDYPMNQEKVEQYEYPLTFNVKYLSDEMYAALQKLQCGDTKIKFYYASGMDETQFVYGKQGGIVPKKVSVTFPKGGGKDDRDVAIIKINFLSKGDPDRRINPYA